MKLLTKIMVAMLAGVLSASGGIAATLVTSEGKLTGATGVNVSGSSYDVTFVDGTCAAVYGTCAAASFDFTNVTAARAAAQALLDQVFLDGASGNFDGSPALTYGCTSTTSCIAQIAYGTSGTNATTARATNYASGGSTDAVTTASYAQSTNTGGVTNIVYARFAAASVVPEPATWAMMIGGFGMIGFAMRARRRVAASFS